MRNCRVPVSRIPVSYRGNKRWRYAIILPKERQNSIINSTIVD